ncbi:myelin basic protein isoform X2 [Thalassophryne amazonica]|uniref:myelin basic protein isoform X2 n=2 Tax=Thalassophryne amazonica TaxID=390379 RepID=UPI001470BAC9|nr:myelin basic protein isoform X2 [Thalassophryne amazonica]
MATASTSGQTAFGLGRKKKNPGLMDQISKFFAGEKKKRSKGSFRGHLAASPQQSSARRRPNENAVVHFFRSIVTSPRPKSRASSPRADSTKSPVRRRREQSTLSRIFNLVSSLHLLLFLYSVYSPKYNSDALTTDQVKPSPVLLPNAGVPSSKPSEDQTTDPVLMGQEEEEAAAADPPPPPTITH